jgi:hypothetical protein
MSDEKLSATPIHIIVASAHPMARAVSCNSETADN